MFDLGFVNIFLSLFFLKEFLKKGKYENFIIPPKNN